MRTIRRFVLPVKWSLISGLLAFALTSTARDLVDCDHKPGMPLNKSTSDFMTDMALQEMTQHPDTLLRIGKAHDAELNELEKLTFAQARDQFAKASPRVTQTQLGIGYSRDCVFYWPPQDHQESEPKLDFMTIAKSAHETSTGHSAPSGVVVNFKSTCDASEVDNERARDLDPVSFSQNGQVSSSYGPYSTVAYRALPNHTLVLEIIKTKGQLSSAPKSITPVGSPSELVGYAVCPWTGKTDNCPDL